MDPRYHTYQPLFLALLGFVRMSAGLKLKFKKRKCILFPGVKLKCVSVDAQGCSVKYSQTDYGLHYAATAQHLILRICPYSSDT